LHAGLPLARLADSWGSLLATTAAAHGLFAGNPRSIGISGGFATPSAKRFLERADVILVAGASLNQWTTEGGELFSQARVVQIDLVRAAEGVTTWVQADVLGVVEALQITGDGWNGELPGPLTYPRRDAFDDQSTQAHIDPRALMIAFDELLPRERAIVLDGGQFEGWPAMYLTVSSPDQFVTSQSFQSVGLGLATAIGASVARPDRVTVAVIGDGGARMSLTELEAAVRLSLPLLVLVMNDAAYGAEVHDFAPLGVDVELARFPDLDFAAIAQGLGAHGATVRSVADLRRLEPWLSNPEGPVLIDCKIKHNVVGGW
jgi:thiamine pyrophosphate-dependent acetolactate synthase large subunit-like protein